MIKLSLIIPYYCTYEYTIRLLKELRLQTEDTDEVEVILVDDGCNEFRFDNISDKFNIIHLPEHSGACVAWNIGIRAARGEFIGFIDSDDMIMMNYIEVLLQAIDANLADEIMFDWVDVDRNEVIKHPGARAIWKAIYRRNIVPFFDENYVHHTNMPFQAKLRKTLHTRKPLHMSLYCYRSRRKGSISWQYRNGILKNPWER